MRAARRSLSPLAAPDGEPSHLAVVLAAALSGAAGAGIDARVDDETESIENEQSKASRR